jgi:hypothetical protein
VHNRTRKPVALSVLSMPALILVALVCAMGTGWSEAQQGAMQNCPQAGKWATSVWRGNDGTDAQQALATCGEGRVAAAYSIDFDTQTWSRWFAGRPEISNLTALNDMQSVMALGEAETPSLAWAGTSAQRDAMQNCPLPGKWAISVWSGQDGTDAGQALATCGVPGMAAAYYLDAETQGWLRWFADKPELSNLPPLNDMQGVLALGSTVDSISFVPDVTHSGDLVVEGKETVTIEGVKYFQQGNIYVNDQAKLVVRDSQLMIGRGDVPTIHVYIFVGPEASLEIEDSAVFPEPTGLTLVVIQSRGTISITSSPTSIHLLEVYEGSQATITDSRVVFDIGGLIQVSGGDTRISNSIVGALGISIPAGSRGEVVGLKSGVYLESWDVHRDLGVTDIPYDLTLEKTYVLKDTLPPGPYERGWILFIDPQAQVKVSHSELRKVFLSFEDQKISLEDLKIGIPSSLHYKTVELEDVTLTGEWGIDLLSPNVADATIRNSDFLFVQISGQATLNLIDSDMVEFIPRDFYGTIVCENVTWHNAGEIVGGKPYHSMGNDFTIKGGLTISPELRDHLQWNTAQVTREYEVQVAGESGEAIRGTLQVAGKTFPTDDAGKAVFSLTFTGEDYLRSRELEVVGQHETIARREVDFFSQTPMRIEVSGF